MFEDLVSVYRNFLGQRSGSVSQSNSFSCLAFFVSSPFVVSLLSFTTLYSFSLLFFSLLQTFVLSLDQVDLFTARPCLSPPFLLRQSGSKDEVFLVNFFSFFFRFDYYYSSIRTCCTLFVRNTRLNGLVLRDRPCHVSAPFRLS